MQPIHHLKEIHIVQCWGNNTKEIINVLNMKEHMVFGTGESPWDRLKEGSNQPASHEESAQNKSLAEGAATARLQQQVWTNDREQ